MREALGQRLGVATTLRRQSRHQFRYGLIRRSQFDPLLIAANGFAHPGKIDEGHSSHAGQSICLMPTRR